MSLRDKLHRYFVANHAPIFCIRRRYAGSWARDRKVIPFRCANASGYFWMGWEVSWRIPMADCWHWHPSARKWMTERPEQPPRVAPEASPILAIILGAISGAVVGLIAGAGGVWVVLGMVLPC